MDSSGPMHDFSVATIGLCSSIVVRNEIIGVLATRPRAKEEIMLKLEAILRDMAKNDKALYDSYGPEADFVVQALRTNPNVTRR